LRRRPPASAFRWGLLLSACFYLALVLTALWAGQHVFGLGAAFGVAQGVYWFGANLMTFDTVPAAVRMRFYGLSSALFSASGVAGPLLGALVLSLLPQLSGYLLVFALALMLYGLGFVASLRVPAGPPMEVGGPGESWRLLARPAWRLTFATIVVRGLREGVTGLAGIYVVYSASHQAWVVGLYGGVTAAARVASSLAISRHITPARRQRSLWVGSLGMTASALLLLGGQSLGWIFAYGVGSALAMPFYTVPNAAVPLDVMDRDPAVARLRVSYMLSREVALNLGRLASIGALAWWSSRLAGPIPLVSVLVCTSAVQAWVGWAVGRLTRMAAVA
jgi:YQGE family putative transporter